MKCENCTGADLKSLLVNAQLEAVHDVMNNQLYNQGRETVNTRSTVMFFAIHILAHILPTQHVNTKLTDDLHHNKTDKSGIVKIEY